MSIKFIRIDDRLIHGQVVTAWIKTYQAKKILIIDDIVAKDEFLKNVLKMVKPSGVDLIIKGTEHLDETIQTIEENKANAILLMKTPDTAKKVFESPVLLKELNVGGMGANAKREALYKNVSASKEEVAILKEIEEMGVKVYFQATPNDKQIELHSLIKGGL